MALSAATITYDLSDYGLADFDSRRTKVWATNNVNGPVIDTEGNTIHLGSANGTVNADGTGSITVPTPGTGSNPASWQTTIHVDYPDRNANRGRDSKSFGPFTITVDADLADLVTQMEIPPETLGGDAWLATIDADDSSQYRVQQDARLAATIVRSAAVGGSGADQSALINAELAALPTGKTLQLPQGTIYLDNPLTPVDYATLTGSGRGTALYYRGTGAMVTLTSRVQAKFRNLRIHLTAAGQTAFDFSNSFRCSLTGLIIEGEHVSAVDTTYRTQIGVNFRDNAGDNRVIDCDLNNLGIGVQTSAVINHVAGSVFGSCWRSISGGDPTGVQFLAGLSVTACTLVGSGTAGVTDAHVYIDGSAAEFWFSHVWMEKADNTIIVGNGSGGPRSFGLRDARVSGRFKCLELNRGTSPVLQDITFGNEAGAYTPVELAIDDTGCPTGSASGVRSAQGFDLADADFPVGWFAYRRGVLRIPSAVNGDLNLAGKAKITNTTGVAVEVAQASGNTSDLFSMARGGTIRARADAFGNYFGVSYGFQGTSVAQYQGTGSPEGVVSAGVGSTFQRRDGGAGTCFYVKESGSTGNTGWVAK